MVCGEVLNCCRLTARAGEDCRLALLFIKDVVEDDGDESHVIVAVLWASFSSSVSVRSMISPPPPPFVSALAISLFEVLAIGSVSERDKYSLLIFIYFWAEKK